MIYNILINDMATSYTNPDLSLADNPFFNSADIDEIGGLCNAGTSRSTRRNDWADLRKFRRYPYYTLNIMLEGSSGSYRNARGFQCTLGYGDFFLNFPKMEHLYGPNKGESWSEIYVGFRGEVFDLYHQQKYFYEGIPIWHLSDPAPWIERLEKMLRGKRPSARLERALGNLEFLHLILSMINAATPVDCAATVNDWVDRARSLLVEDFSSVDLPTIAEELGMGYSSFRQHFKQRVGVSPYQYRQNRRMEKACRMLRENPSKKCQEIAFALGFSRNDYFSRQFHKFTGMTPSEYRRKYRGKRQRKRRNINTVN